MKKIISGILAFTLLFGTTSVMPNIVETLNNSISASAYTDAWGREYYVYDDLRCQDKSNGTVSIIGFDVNKTTAEIPEKINGKVVSEIGRNAFYGAEKLVSIKIPDTVTYIGETAFYECFKLQSIVLPANLKEIDSRAFYEAGLKNVTFNSKLEIIGDYAFAYNSLEKITVPDNVKSIKERAFFACQNLTYIKFPKKVDNFGERVLEFCYALEEIVLPPENTKVPDYLAWFCKGLKKVTIPDGVTEIGPKAFKDCESLETIVLPDSVKSIGEGAFENDVSLKSMDLPNNLQTIDYCAFKNCSGLESITIPASVNSIGNFAFNKCNNLTAKVYENSFGESYFKANSSESNYIIICIDNSNYLKYQFSKCGSDNYSVRFLLVVDEEDALNAETAACYISDETGFTSDEISIATAYRNVKADGKIVSAGEGKVFLPCMIKNVSADMSVLTAHFRLDGKRFERTSVYNGIL